MKRFQLKSYILYNENSVLNTIIEWHWHTKGVEVKL